jgi:hypothetical protein
MVLAAPVVASMGVPPTYTVEPETTMLPTELGSMWAPGSHGES